MHFLLQATLNEMNQRYHLGSYGKKHLQKLEPPVSNDTVTTPSILL